MAVDERGRLQLADAAKRAFGEDAGITLMELLPPVGWADVATKHDLARLDLRFDALEARMDGFDARMDRFEARMDRFDGRMDRFETRMGVMEATFDGKLSDIAREVRAQTWKLMTLMVAVVGVVVAAVRL